MASNLNLQLNNYIRKHSQQLSELYNAVNIISTRIIALEKSVSSQDESLTSLKKDVGHVKDTLDSLDIEENEVEVSDEDQDQDQEQELEEGQQEETLEVVEQEEEQHKQANISTNIKEITAEPKKRGRKKKNSS